MTLHAWLQESAKRGRLVHAYLFTGPSTPEKANLVRSLISLLLCDSGDACGHCPSCRDLSQDTHPDYHLIEPEKGKVRLGIEVIRQNLILPCQKSPVRGQHQVFDIREADKMTGEASNTLLKTLEEPPQGTFIILQASSTDDVLPTLLSRCRLIGTQTTAEQSLVISWRSLIPETLQQEVALSQELSEKTREELIAHFQAAQANCWGEKRAALSDNPAILPTLQPWLYLEHLQDAVDQLHANANVKLLLDRLFARLRAIARTEG